MGAWSRRGPLIRAAVVAMLAAVTMLAGSAPAQAVSDAVFSWGGNLNGGLGNGGSVAGYSPGPASGLSGVSAIGAGGRVDFSTVEGPCANNEPAPHSLALLSDGTVMAWGANACGQLGDGNTTDSAVPVAVSGLSGVTAVAAGGTFSLALLSNGTVMSWGDNANGSLGNNPLTGPEQCSGGPCATTPVTVDTGTGNPLTGVVAIAAGALHGLALLSNGDVMAWGYNAHGELGTGSSGGGSCGCVTYAVQTGVHGASAIAAGGFNSYARLSDGTVRSWGDNAFGQLGDGSTGGSSATPVEVSGLTGVAAIAAGSAHALALRTGGSVMAWGQNSDGQLGDGATTNLAQPAQVSGLSGVTAIAGGTSHSLALLASGRVESWGDNSDGELGDGSPSGPIACAAIQCATTPVPVTALSGAAAISAGEQFSLALAPTAQPPAAAILFPGGGGTYLTGASVATSFRCQEGAGEPGLSSCADSHGAKNGSGDLSTSAPGRYAYTVTAASKDGQDASASISYNVVSLRIRRRGCRAGFCAELALRGSAAGTVTAGQFFLLAGRRAGASAANPLISRASVKLRKGHTATLRLSLTAAGKRAIGRRRSMRVAVIVTYAPAGIQYVTKVISVTFTQRRR